MFRFNDAYVVCMGVSVWGPFIRIPRSLLLVLFVKMRMFGRCVVVFVFVCERECVYV